MKISYAQLAILLLLGRIFTLMTYAPMSAGGQEILPPAIAISTGLQALLSLPIIALGHRFDGRNIVQLTTEKSLFAGRLTALFYLIFFVIMGADSYAHFGSFLSNVFFPQGSKPLFALILVGIAVYAASRGLQGIARTAVLVFALFAAMLLLITIMSLSSGAADWQAAAAIQLQEKTALFPAVLEDFGRSSELAAVAILMGYLKKDETQRSIFGYLIGKAVILEVIVLLIITIMGNYARLVDFPFFSLGSYAGLGGVQRLDAVYLVVWTLIAVVRLATAVVVGAELLSAILPKFRFKNIAVGGAIFLFGLPLLYGAGMSKWVFPAGLLILFFGIPLLLLIITGRKPHEKLR